MRAWGGETNTYSAVAGLAAMPRIGELAYAGAWGCRMGGWCGSQAVVQTLHGIGCNTCEIGRRLKAKPAALDHELILTRTPSNRHRTGTGRLRDRSPLGQRVGCGWNAQLRAGLDPLQRQRLYVLG